MGDWRFCLPFIRECSGAAPMPFPTSIRFTRQSPVNRMEAGTDTGRQPDRLRKKGNTHQQAVHQRHAALQIEQDRAKHDCHTRQSQNKQLYHSVRSKNSFQFGIA